MNHKQNIDFLISRLVHDLASPLGAINNGLELAAEEQNAHFREEALALVRRSAKRAYDLMGFFRMAYGAAGRNANFTAAQALSLGQAWLSDSRLQLQNQSEIPSEQARLLMHLIILAAEIMPRGGIATAMPGPYLLLEGACGGMLNDLQNFFADENITLSARNVVLLHAREEADLLQKKILFVQENETRSKLGCFA